MHAASPIGHGDFSEVIEAMDKDGRSQMQFDDLPAALAALIRQSIGIRQAAGELPALLAALRQVDGAGPSGADEILALHLAGVDIALQVDGRFNGLVHPVILKRTVVALAPSGDSGPPGHDGGSPEHNGGSPEHGAGSPEHNGGSPEHNGGSPEHDRLLEVLRARLPGYLDWMYDFISAQLDASVREPRELLGLDDPVDSSVVILVLGEFVSVCHGHLSRWELVG